MDDLEVLIQEKFVPLRKKALENVTKKHPHIFSIVNMALSGKKNHVGLQVTENGELAREYTFQLEGFNIASVDSGTLSSEVHHPFIGVLKPYAIIERSTIEKMVKDEQSFIQEPFSTITKYLPNITIKFL